MEKLNSMSTVNSTVGVHESVTDKQATWKEYLAISKTGIVMSNLITAFAGLYLASHYTGTTLATDPLTALLAMLGTAFIIAGASVLNNYIDRDIDHLMERTKERPTVNGQLSGRQTLTYGLVLAILGTLFLSMTTLTAAVIGFSGLLIYVVLYSMWTKRTTTLNTIVGSFSGAVPPLIGWAAIDPGLHPIAWTLFLIMFMWQPPHFLALAMKRADEYRAAGIPMLPVVAGFAVTKRQIIWYVAALIPVSLLVADFGIIYTVSAVLLGGGWLVLGLSGLRAKDDVKWARQMFVYSLNYLTVLFVLMIVVHMI
ncbi:protoheme IX farnesyltransferase [Salisediminibacterium halotolerans]|nr:protoheme IX farnesyltransferase [Actinophytocola xinjiangensis]RPE87571.1 protoheme IX farnesyltransferase [Salisediminibacterium halotolerans]TWG35173.1 protoheme IX farnesyltransferase [Salisediminibacterium halotolerans]GEL08616.1 protoheme IX farnesyltransferase [Salisediminibacterium halotolerans]